MIRLALPIILICGVASAQSQLLLQLPGIEGNATVEGYDDWIPILSYSAGFIRPVEQVGGGRNRSPAVANDFFVTAYESNASPKILQSLFDGKTFKDMKFHQVTTFGDRPEPNAIWEFSNVNTTSFNTDGVVGENPTFQSYSFAFEELKYTAIELDDTGKKLGSTESTWNFRTNATPTRPVDTFALADLDLNQRLDATDLDLLSVVVRNNSGGTRFDLNQDGTVDAADRSYWIDVLYGTIAGDADLNRTVDFVDFLRLSQGFGNSSGWGGGDFDGNGTTEFADFLALSENFGRTTATPPQFANGIASVPEPWGAYLFIGASTSMVLFFRPKRRN